MFKSILPNRLVVKIGKTIKNTAEKQAKSLKIQ